ncbi:TIGR03943 family putative permease subunit [Anaerovorax odorimutans]|uniref:TIGR03943 family putative permease subunit n=1 Tax=Anaerovorax odorimutans TaxID=109327 RepID=UPI00040E9ED8|nr:TIGR03943 family protein [Anaerovorax odorimutans]
MKSKNAWVYNINILIEIFVLLGFAAFFIVTITTSSVTQYVHPRNIPFMLFAAAAMIIIGFILIYQTFVKKKKINENNDKVEVSMLIFFVIPLIMAFIIPPMEFDSSAKNVSSVQLSTENSMGNSKTANNENNDKQPENSYSTNDENNEDNYDEEFDSFSENYDGSGSNYDIENGNIVMDSNKFYHYLNEFYSDIDDYEGVGVEAYGFVFKDNQQFPDTSFVLGRLMMVCCAADMQTVGLLCNYDKSSELKMDSWVRVTGTIKKTELNGETIPSLEVKSIEPIEKPEQDYIYPY